MPPGNPKPYLLAAALCLSLLTGVASAQTASDFQTVKVKPGETLWDISQRYLDDPKRWDEILKHNSQLGSDPTVALPGMSLRVPVKLLKAALRVAVLTYIEGEIMHRARESATWTKAKQGMALSPGDVLKTQDWSRARIKFPYGSVLNLDSHSEAVIQPELPDGPDLKLVRGVLKAKHLKLGAAGSAIAPHSEDTTYEVTVKPGVPVKVQVFSGAVSVAAGGATAEVVGGSEIEVPDGGAPLAARPMGGFVAKPRRESKESTTDLGVFKLDLESLKPGEALAGLHVQLSRTQDFKTILLDRVFEPEEKISLSDAGIGSGVYWWRAAPIDLLGQAGAYSEPKRAVFE